MHFVLVDLTRPFHTPTPRPMGSQGLIVSSTGAFAADADPGITTASATSTQIPTPAKRLIKPILPQESGLNDASA